MSQPVQLEQWDVPFSGSRLPSIFLISESHGDSTITVVIAPSGVDAYPKYLIRFSAVYAFTCEEEAGGTLLPELTGRFSPTSGCAYIWENSPYAAAYAPFIDLGFGGKGPLRHYVFLGGDNNVGVVTGDIPRIEEIGKSRQLTITHEI